MLHENAVVKLNGDEVSLTVNPSPFISINGIDASSVKGAAKFLIGLYRFACLHVNVKGRSSSYSVNQNSKGAVMTMTEENRKKMLLRRSTFCQRGYFMHHRYIHFTTQL